MIFVAVNESVVMMSTQQGNYLGRSMAFQIWCFIDLSKVCTSFFCFPENTSPITQQSLCSIIQLQATNGRRTRSQVRTIDTSYISQTSSTACDCRSVLQTLCAVEEVYDRNILSLLSKDSFAASRHFCQCETRYHFLSLSGLASS